MKHTSVFGRAVRFCTAILLCVLLLPLASEQPRAAMEAWTRTLDPVIITGNQLSLFNGVALADLFVYAYDGSTWSMVPFQFDEVNSEGSFVPDGGLLDGNDQLVFMAADLGDMATTYAWPDDADSRNHSRYEVHVTNPLHPSEEGWVYVYHSVTLAPTFAPYVTWSSASTTITADTYILGYTPSVHLGIDSLQLNGYAGDVLDRSKFRLKGECWNDNVWDKFRVTEESEEVLDTWDPPDILGPVRVGGGTSEEQSWAYASMFEARSVFRPAEVDPEDCEDYRYNYFQATEDWQNPAVSGMAPMLYFDSNTPVGVMVDGAFDSIPQAPLATWRQVSGLKGSVVEVIDIDGGGAAVYNYYLDLNEEEPTDTGDLRAFADAGFWVFEPANPVLISTAHYILDPLEPNVGSTYQQYRLHPLQATAAVQDFSDPAPSGIGFTYSPTPSFSGEEITFTATADGLGPFTYDWVFGDDSSVASGKQVDHTFASGGTIPVTLTVTNDYGDAEFVLGVLIFPDGTVPFTVYLPLVARHAP